MNPEPPRGERDPLDAWREWGNREPVPFFQTLEWAELIARHCPRYELCPIAGSGFLIPLMRQRRWRGLADSYYGLPLMTSGGVLLEREADQAIWTRAYQALSDLRAAALTVVFPPGESPPPSDWFEWEEGSTHLIPLEGGWESVWARFLQRGRTATRKAETVGVVARRDHSETAMQAHWEIIRSHLPEWGLDPAPTPDLVRDALRTSAGRLYLAEHEGRVVVTVLVFARGREVFFWQGARVAADPPPGATNLLYARVLEDACAEGIERANLGASLGNPDIEKFKESLGGVKTPFRILKKTHSLVKWGRYIFR
ncbi:MAG: GNAT family N-acetyltransferase [Candidatus Omnitrophica bacterium]|nr:GNAT family N-acetyltransferase [Candidatus Omnitrophota bacterium]